MAKIEKLHLMLLIDTMNQWWIDSGLISDYLKLEAAHFLLLKLYYFNGALTSTFQASKW